MKLIPAIGSGLISRQRKNSKAGRSVAIERLEGRELFSTYMVTSLADSGGGSLRQEIANANAHAGADVIDFKSGLSGTITLTSGQLVVSDSVTINGPGSSKLTISGNNTNRVFYLKSTTANVSISGLTMTKGQAGTGFGGAIESFSNLTLSNVVFSKNMAGTHYTSGGVGGGGGGLMNYGKATISNTTFDSNKAIGYDLSNYGGGAIFNDGTLTLTHSTVSNNSTALSPSVTMSFGGDVAGVGGIYNIGTLLATDDTIAYNAAGNGSTGGLWNPGKATVISCTIVHNTGGFVAGGIESFGTLKIGNTIVALNTYLPNHGPSPDLDSSGGSFTDLGHNLLGVGPSNLTLSATDQNGTLALPLNPDLGALQFNGGPTKTMAIGFLSPAFNNGSNTLNATYAITTDQRGDPRIENVNADIGAYEAGKLVI